MASVVQQESVLQKVLFTDALTCAACGLLMTAGAGELSAFTLIPQSLLSYAGASLFPIALLMAYVAARAPHSAAWVWLLIAGNVAWTLASLWLLFMSGLPLNVYGQLFVGLQAAVVALLSALEMRYAPRAAVGLRSAT
jgi:hypothetical protein